MVSARVCSLTRTSHCESLRISAPKRRPAPVLFFFFVYTSHSAEFAALTAFSEPQFQFSLLNERVQFSV